MIMMIATITNFLIALPFTTAIISMFSNFLLTFLFSFSSSFYYPRLLLAI
jgi:hypothetical protein